MHPTSQSGHTLRPARWISGSPLFSIELDGMGAELWKGWKGGRNLRILPLRLNLCIAARMNAEAIMIGDRRSAALTALMTLAVFVPGSASAAVKPSAAHEAEVARCIREASGGRAWLEKTLWGLRDQEAGWVGAEVANSNGTHDLGPLQVNSFWVPRVAALTRRSAADVRTWLIHDPCFNVQVASWIFLSGLKATGDYWVAVGTYHSPTPWRQERYRRRVVRHLVTRFGPSVFSQGSSLTPGIGLRGIEAMTLVPARSE